MASGQIEIIAPSKEKHGKQLLDFLSKVFSTWRGYYIVRGVFENRIIHGHYDWDASRIGVVDGRAVAHYGVCDYKMRIGSVNVRAGGIGAVATDPDFRKKGLMNRTTRASIKAMRDLGYDMTILFGIDNFYHKFGYVRAWPCTTYTVNVKDLPKERPSYRLHKFALKQRDDIEAIYNRENKGLTGTAVRPTYTRSSLPQENHGYLWRDSKGRTIGYVVVSSVDGRLLCNDAGGDTEEVLRALASIARKLNLREIRFECGLHYNHPLARRIRLSNSTMTVMNRKCGGAMVHLLNLESTLRKMSPELSRRLKKSPLSNWKGDLVISTPSKRIHLRIASSKVNVVEKGPSKNAIRGGEEIVQLLIGTGDPWEIAASAGIKVSGEARHLLPVLFPNQHPSLGFWDMY